MSTLSQGLEAGSRVLKATVYNIENNVIKSRREDIDKKTISVASRVVELLEKISHLFDTLSKKVQHSDRELVILSQYTYIFRSQKEIILVRTRPEHVVLTYNQEGNFVSLKTRNSSLVISPNALMIGVRDTSISISPLSIDQFTIRRDELRIALKALEKAIYRRLLPYIEQRVMKGGP